MKNGFEGWNTLAPIVINSLITYNADISNIFKSCGFCDVLTAKLRENNRKAMLSEQQRRVENMETAIKDTVEQTVYPKIEQVLHIMYENHHEILSSFNTNMDAFRGKLSLNEQNINNMKQTIDSTINNTVKTINSKIESTSSGLNATIQTMGSITDFVKRLQACVENISERIDKLENPEEFPKSKFSQEEATNKVKEIIEEESKNPNNKDSIDSEAFRHKVYEIFQQKYGFERIEFVALKRIIDKVCMNKIRRGFNRSNFY